MSIYYSRIAKESLDNLDSFEPFSIDIGIIMCYLMDHRLILLNQSTAKEEGYNKWKKKKPRTALLL